MAVRVRGQCSRRREEGQAAVPGHGLRFLHKVLVFSGPRDLRDIRLEGGRCPGRLIPPQGGGHTSGQMLRQPGIRTRTRPGGTAQCSVGTTHACAPTTQWGLSVPQGGALGLLQKISTDLVLKARELGSQPGIQAPQCGQGPPCLQRLVVPGSLASRRLHGGFTQFGSPSSHGHLLPGCL